LESFLPAGIVSIVGGAILVPNKATLTRIDPYLWVCSSAGFITGTFLPGGLTISTGVFLGISLVMLILLRKESSPMRVRILVAFICLITGAALSGFWIVRSIPEIISSPNYLLHSGGVDSLGLLILLFTSMSVSVLTGWPQQRRNALLKWLMSGIVFTIVTHFVLGWVDPDAWRTIVFRTVLLVTASLLIGCIAGIFLYRWRASHTTGHPRGLLSIAAFALVLLSFSYVQTSISVLTQIPISKNYTDQMAAREGAVMNTKMTGETTIEVVRINEQFEMEPPRDQNTPANLCAAAYYQVRSYSAP
jgi:hypothetical protein